jgi:hypothetical protein
MIDLVFEGNAYPIAKGSIFALIYEHRDLMDSQTYTVSSSFSVDLFEIFIASLRTQSDISVTKANAAHLALLAKEFCLSELASRCEGVLGVQDAVSELDHRGYPSPKCVLLNPVDFPMKSNETTRRRGTSNERGQLTGRSAFVADPETRRECS